MLTLKNLSRIGIVLMLALGLSFGVAGSVAAETVNTGASLQISLPGEDGEAGDLLDGLLAQLVSFLNALLGDVLPDGVNLDEILGDGLPDLTGEE